MKTLSTKNLFRILIDAALLSVSLVLATYIRLEGEVFTAVEKFIWNEQIVKILPAVVLIKLVILFFLGSYKKFWRYTSVSDLIELSKNLFI